MGAFFESLIALGIVLVLVVAWGLSVLTKETVFTHASTDRWQQSSSLCRPSSEPGRCPPS